MKCRFLIGWFFLVECFWQIFCCSSLFYPHTQKIGKFLPSNNSTKEGRWDETAFGVKTVASCTGNRTNQSVLCDTRCSSWKRPSFTPNAVSSHLPSFVLINWFRFISVQQHDAKWRIRQARKAFTRTSSPTKNIWWTIFIQVIILNLRSIACPSVAL